MTAARWPMLGVLLTAHAWFMLFVWLGLVVVSAGVTTGIAVWGHVDQSIWHQVAAQVLRWFALGVGVDAVTTYLRLHVAHGRTRGDFLRQLWPYFAALAGILSVLVTTGYLVERGVYALAGWPHVLPDATLFSSTGEFLGIAATYVLQLVLWTVAGTMLGAAFTRDVLLGLLVIPLAALIVAPGEILLGINGIPVLGDVVARFRLPELTCVATCVAGAAVGCAAVWGIVRDIPVRPRVA